MYRVLFELAALDVGEVRNRERNPFYDQSLLEPSIRPRK